MISILKAFFSVMVQGSGPRPLILCGPSGSGKSTLLRRLLDEYPNTFGFSVSHTTRSPRPREQDGVHYHFTDAESMRKAIEAGEFLEHATFSGNMYGTSKRAVEAVRSTGKVCVLDIDVQGVEQIRETDLKPLAVFVRPPSIAELEKRLIKRKTETKESLALRLETARKEMEYGETPGNFDMVVTNDDFDKAYEVLKEYIINELKKQQEEGIHVNLKTSEETSKNTESK